MTRPALRNGPFPSKTKTYANRCTEICFACLLSLLSVSVATFFFIAFLLFCSGYVVSTLFFSLSLSFSVLHCDAFSIATINFPVCVGCDVKTSLALSFCHSLTLSLWKCDCDDARIFMCVCNGGDWALSMYSLQIHAIHSMKIEMKLTMWAAILSCNQMPKSVAVFRIIIWCPCHLDVVENPKRKRHTNTNRHACQSQSQRAREREREREMAASVSVWRFSFSGITVNRCSVLIEVQPFFISFDLIFRFLGNRAHHHEQSTRKFGSEMRVCV